MTLYMFDTNIFNRILDNSLGITSPQGTDRFFATHIQLDELGNTRDVARRNSLLRVFEDIQQKPIPTESAVYGASKYGAAKYGGSNMRLQIQTKLDAVRKKRNNLQDSLIAETAMKNRLTLVTEDGDLFNVVHDLSGNVIRFADFLKLYLG